MDNPAMRRCSHCGRVMDEGFCIFDGQEYYCSKDCLHSAYSDAEYNSLYESNEAYWTQWDKPEAIF